MFFKKKSPEKVYDIADIVRRVNELEKDAKLTREDVKIFKNLFLEEINRKYNLSPCPFCGSKPVINSQTVVGTTYKPFGFFMGEEIKSYLNITVECEGNCKVSPKTSQYETVEEAVAAWEERKTI